MTKVQKQEYINKRTVAYYSGFTGIEIKEIQYGIEDYVVYVSGAWGSRKIQRVHRTKIYYNLNGSPYFKCDGVRIPLGQCIRTNI